MQFLINTTEVGLPSRVRFLPPLFGVIRWAQLVKRFFKVNGDKDVESTVQHHRPPPLLGAQHTKLDAWLSWEA